MQNLLEEEGEKAVINQATLYSLYALHFVVNKEYEGGINWFPRSKLLIKER